MRNVQSQYQSQYQSQCQSITDFLTDYLNFKIKHQMKASKMNVLQRVAAPTPKFFKAIRNVGIALGTVGAAILAAPVALPSVIVTIAGYLTTAGAIAGCIGQTAVDEGKLPSP